VSVYADICKMFATVRRCQGVRVSPSIGLLEDLVRRLLLQVSGCVGVPLYRIYPRKTEWVRERKKGEKKEEPRLQKRDSVDDLIDQVRVNT
jgi:hypothetical protein